MPNSQIGLLYDVNIYCKTKFVLFRIKIIFSALLDSHLQVLSNYLPTLSYIFVSGDNDFSSRRLKLFLSDYFFLLSVLRRHL